MMPYEEVYEAHVGMKFKDRNGDMWVTTELVDWDDDGPRFCNFTTGAVRNTFELHKHLVDYA